MSLTLYAHTGSVSTTDDSAVIVLTLVAVCGGVVLGLAVLILVWSSPITNVSAVCISNLHTKSIYLHQHMMPSDHTASGTSILVSDYIR